MITKADGDLPGYSGAAEDRAVSTGTETVCRSRHLPEAPASADGALEPHLAGIDGLPRETS